MKLSDCLQQATGYWPSAVLNAAAELGLFAHLHEQIPVSALARRLDLAPAYLTALLDTLCGMGVLEKNVGGSYVLVPALRGEVSGALADSLRYNRDLYALWGKLDACVRDGHPVTDGTGQLGADRARTESFVRGMEGRGRMLAPAVLPRLELPAEGRLLDLACGSGVFSRGLLQTHPGLALHLFDLPGVLQVTEVIWGEEGVANGAEFHAGDYRKDPLPEGFDAVVYCGALHQESYADAEGLISRAARSLVAGGRLQVIDFMLEQDRTQPLFSAYFSLNMMLLQPNGHVFTYPEVEQLCLRAGLQDVRIQRSDGNCPYGIVSGVRGA